MELNINDQKKIIALYLPQFHTIPENDKWWGKGFTEWTNTRKAKPLFDGHYQPKTPLNQNYYDLSDVTVMEKQAALAKKYGVFGFCYYHYWFKGGKKLLEKPVENMLENKKVDIPFCLCWANENWSRNWDGGNREIIMEQDYGGQKDWEKHFQYLLNFFKDERYITWNGSPILVVYKPEEIEQFNKMRRCFEKLAVEAGFPGLIIVRQFPTSYFNKSENNLNIDYTVKFEPVMASYTEAYKNYDGMNSKVKAVFKNFLKAVHSEKVWKSLKKMKANIKPVKKELIIEDYDETWNVIINKEPYGEKLINGAFTAWDNTARNVCGKVYHGSTPEKFEGYMKELLKKDSALDLIFINAWNEWAEGAYLEPDEKYGYSYLEALKRAIDSAV